MLGIEATLEKLNYQVLQQRTCHFLYTIREQGFFQLLHVHKFHTLSSITHTKWDSCFFYYITNIRIVRPYKSIKSTTQNNVAKLFFLSMGFAIILFYGIFTTYHSQKIDFYREDETKTPRTEVPIIPTRLMCPHRNRILSQLQNFLW